jgi:hypothetical protein
VSDEAKEAGACKHLLCITHSQASLKVISLHSLVTVHAEVAAGIVRTCHPYLHIYVSTTSQDHCYKEYRQIAKRLCKLTQLHCFAKPRLIHTSPSCESEHCALVSGLAMTILTPGSSCGIQNIHFKFTFIC